MSAALAVYQHGPEEYKELDHMIVVTANRVHRKFREYTTPGDIQGALWEWAVKAPKKITRWRDENDQQNFHRILGAVLWDEATHFSRRQRAQVLGPDETFYYSRAMLVELLPSVYDDEAWVNPPARLVGGRSGKALNEGFGWAATLSDVSRALSKLSGQDQAVLRETYSDGLGRSRYAAKHDIAVSTAQGRLDGALKRLWSELGGPRWLSRAGDREPDDGDGWPAGRRSVSNAHARAITDKQYEGFTDNYGSGVLL